MKSAVGRVAVAAAIVVGIGVVSVGAFAAVQCWRFDASMDTVYDVPLPNIAHSDDPAVIARGKHLVDSLGGCAGRLCHGSDLGGGTPVDVGPVGRFAAPNITAGGLGVAYSDGELGRLIQRGIKKDGRSVRFMPVQDIAWLPQADVMAIVSYLRVAPPVERANAATVIKPLGKILDRRDAFPIDIARRIATRPPEAVPLPEPTAAYGQYEARLCTGCHGEHLSGGRIPGTPSSIPVPLNLTPDATGLRGWTFADFEGVMRRGTRKGGRLLDPFMPIESWSNLDDVEMRALWAFLTSVPPMPFGQR